MSADAQFKALIDRILRCREAEDDAKYDTKEVYAELKAAGYDKTAAGALVAELRKREKSPEKFAERNTILDLYRDAYERASHAHTRVGAVATNSISSAVPPRQTDSPARQSLSDAPGTNTPDPQTSGDDDGYPGKPSSKGAGAKSDGLTSVIGQAANAGISNSNLEQAVTPFEPPAFLLGAPKPLRPHCLNPDLCAGVGRNHCYTCRKAMHDDEVAA